MDTILGNEMITPSDWIPENSIIKVIGVGGGGCNAVTYMYNHKVMGCTFIICNTDKQVLDKSPVPVKIQLGQGLGAGCDPVKGRNCALEAEAEITDKIIGTGTKMLFITAGMGGGTGTGAAPVIAKIAKDAGILTVAVVTLPFKNERNGSYSKAIDGIRELEQNVDSLLVIDNEKILEIYGDLLLHEAFPKTDEVLATAVRSIIEIINKGGFINVDFQDVQNMMKDSGYALMGSGTGSGENRIHDAVENAMASPLLLAFDPKTSKNALINITVGENEFNIRARDLGRIDDEVSKYLGNANRFKRGIVYEKDPEFGDKVQITIIATGIEMGFLGDALDFNEGSIIYIDEDYTYSGVEAGEEISLGSISVDKVGYGSGSAARKFTFRADRKPDLCVTPEDSILELEKVAAIDRMNKID